MTREEFKEMLSVLKATYTLREEINKNMINKKINDIDVELQKIRDVMETMAELLDEVNR